MTGTALLAILLLLIGTFLDLPVAIVLSIVVLLLEVVRAVCARFGLERVTYRRRLERDRVTWGEEIPTAIEVWNRKRMPLAWIRAEDEASPGVVVRERPLVIGAGGASVLRNAWTLAPFERVTRQFHVSAERRGVYDLGPVGLTVGDLFAREAATEQRAGTERFLVRPRTVPATVLHRRDTWGGRDRARAGLTEDPSRFAGVREYAPGDEPEPTHGSCVGVASRTAGDDHDRTAGALEPAQPRDVGGRVARRQHDDRRARPDDAEDHPEQPLERR